MTNEEQAKNETSEPVETKTMDDFKSSELNEEDAKIVKKRAKKLGIDKDAVAKARVQEKNFKIAQELIVHFSEKLQDLGFVLEAIINYSPNGIRPAFDLRPMNLVELQQHEAKKNSLQAQPVVGSEPVKESAVEPADLSA